MRIGLAIWPQSDAEWLELGLTSKHNYTVESIGGEVKDPVSPLDLLIVDGDNPGPHFMGYYKALLSGFGMPSLIILGSTQSPALKAIQWSASETVFIPKPYEIELVIQQVVKKAAAIKESHPKANEEGEREVKTLGYLSTLPLPDLVQMLCMSEWTGMVCVDHLAKGAKGYIYISDGSLYHADSGSFEGLEACYQMLRWGRCKYSFNEEEVLDKMTIQMPWQEIMLEGARLMDESGDSTPNFGSESPGPIDISGIPDIFPTKD
ncbi:MAG: DUF4388 domain-containing protein [Verrucomicrobiota bacterium]